MKYKNAVKIFYTQENLCPDFNFADYGIGFEELTYGDRYLQFPIRFIKKCLLKCLKLRYHYTWRVPGGGGVYKISYNIIISYRIFSD